MAVHAILLRSQNIYIRAVIGASIARGSAQVFAENAARVTDRSRSF